MLSWNFAYMMEQIFVMVPMRHLPQLQLLSSSWLLSGPKVINLSLKNCGIRHMQKIDYWSASICLTLQFFKLKFQCSDSLNCFFYFTYLRTISIWPEYSSCIWSIFAYLFFFSLTNLLIDDEYLIEIERWINLKAS